MADNEHIHHEINYVEFEIADMVQSKRFYESAFGWKFNDYGPDYAGIQKGQGGEAGGHITQEPFEFPGGRRFHFKDPSGNELAVWSEK